MAIERTILIVACLVLTQAICSLSQEIDGETGCPLNINHSCEYCVPVEGNRLGCYCVDDEVTTPTIFTPCKEDIEDPCSSNTNLCQHGGVCIRDGLTGFKCNCTGRYTGETCNITLASCSASGDECKNSKCVETNDADLPIFCQCYDGTQRVPEQNNTCPISPCYDADTSKPVCENNGTCRILNNAAFCECTKGHTGKNCSTKLIGALCEDNPGVCGGAGVCQQQNRPPKYTCLCGNHPYTYAATDIKDLVKCEESGCYAVNPCQNGGTCINRKGKGAAECSCPPRFTGSKCEKQSACFINPCKNGGICEAYNETIHFCKCPTYFTGRNCEIAIPDPCKGINCGQFGVCEDIRGQGICRCDDGLHIDRTPCESPCRNFSCGPGACTPDRNMTHKPTCSCPPDRVGERCELPRDVCREGPRCGGGFCKPNYSAQLGFSCVCEGGKVQTTPCPPSVSCPIPNCGIRGVCVETDGLIPIKGAKPVPNVCQCLQGYITMGDCDGLLIKVSTDAKDTCGTAGKPYPSRNPYKPIGCWCNNGTYIDAMEEGGKNCGAL